tara:strand:+ start:2563 stop:3270 length:708 start_codon:yes stop_codon:yes gene_type:complete
MRYLFGGILSLLLIACQSTSFDVCAGGFETTETQVVKSTTRLAGDTRSATVEVFSIRPQGVAFGTGTVFKYKGKTIVLTAAHVVGGPENTVGIAVNTEEMIATLVYYDELTDLAVLMVPDIAGVDPMKLRPLKGKNLKIGLDVLYSGYPNLSGLLTIEGYIAGLHPRGDLYMHSYGWSGASGSAVFDTSGKLVGILIALDVGQGYVGMPNIIEDVVVVVPIWKLHFELLDLNLEV